MGIRISFCSDLVFDVNVVLKCQASSCGSMAPRVALQTGMAWYSCSFPPVALTSPFLLFPLFVSPLCYSIWLAVKKAAVFLVK